MFVSLDLPAFFWRPMTAEPSASHEVLLAAIAARRDRAAFTALFAHFAPRVKAYFIKTGSGASAAEDLMQDVLLAVWHKSPQFDPARATAAAWIFGIARNLRIDTLRRGRLALAAGEPAEPPVPGLLSDALVAAEERSRSIRRAVEALPEEQLAILRLAFFEDLTHSEIERRLAVPLGTIKSRLRLALAKLRLALKDEP